MIYVHHGEPLFRFDAPEGWLVLDGFINPLAETQPGAPRVISIQPPGEGDNLWIALWSPPELAGLDGAAAYLDGLLADVLSGAVAGPVERMEIGGLAAERHNGSGERGQQPYAYAVNLVQIAPDRLAVAAMLGVPEALVRHEEALSGVFRSIRPEGVVQ